jgi:energy-coupling factor transport system permease protein
MPVIEFSRESTPFHRLSPLVKFSWGGIIMIWLFLIPDPLHMLLFGMIIFLQGVIGAKIPPLRLLKTTLVIGIASVFIVVFQGLLYPGKTILFTIGPFTPTVEGIRVGLVIALRVLSIVAASLTIARTTDPHDIFLSLLKLGIPYKIAYGLFIAIRFIPLMEYEAETIHSAQYVRGITQQKGGLRIKARQLANFLVPFIAVGIRRADQSALAMEVRAFGLHPTRTNLRSLEFPQTGRYFLIAWLAAFIVYVSIVDANILQAINFVPPH